MRWPFSKARGPSQPEQPVVAQAHVKDKHFYRNHPQNATPRTPTPNLPGNAQVSPDIATSPDRSSSVRKRRRSPELPFELNSNLPERKTSRLRGSEMRRRNSDGSGKDITALPGSRRLDPSPHLRRSIRRPHKSAERSVARSFTMPTSPQAGGDVNARSTSVSQKRRLSKRDEHRARALREDEVRAMSNPPTPSKRVSGHGDMLNRDTKKARRTFTPKTDPEDQRGSNVSLPFQDSIHSSMSGVSEKRGWEIPGLGLLRPRPTVRASGSRILAHSSSFHSSHGLSRNSSRKDKEKLPVVPEGVKHKDRRRVAELADDFDATDLRILLERDTRRTDRKRLLEQERLHAKLKRRAERARREEVERATAQPTPPTAIHPALREATPVERTDQVEDFSPQMQAPPTPTSDFEDSVKEAPAHTAEIQPAAAVRHYALPEQSSLPSPTPDPYRLQDPLDSGIPTPSETNEDPIIATAQELRYSQGRLSQVVPTPPLSPVQSGARQPTSPLREEYSPRPENSPSQQVFRNSFGSFSKKSSTWASIFRRGSSTRRTEPTPSPPPPPPPPAVPAALPNVSHDSVTAQPLPPHLMGNTSRRLSGTPRRTQSIFREDLPESLQASASRGASPDVLAAANVAAARRGKLGSLPGAKPLPVLPDTARSHTPETDEPSSELGVSASLASIDSEGSWLTGRPAKRKSHQSHVRNSISSAKRREGDNNSYEELGVPDEDHVRRLTPSPEDQESVIGAAHAKAEGNPLLHRETSQRRPNVVLRNETAKSSHGLVADMHGGETPQGGSLRGSLQNSIDSGSDYSPEASVAGRSKVEYGQGHARHISSGSAKLLDIKARSPRNSVVSTSDLSRSRTKE